MRALKIIGFIFLLLVFFVSGLTAGYLLPHPKSPVGKSSKKISLDYVQEVIDKVKERYVEEVPEDKLIKGAAKGVIEALDDPYSHIFDPTHFKLFQDDTSGFFYGVGIQIDLKDHYPVVVSPIEGTPAYKAGMKAGDVILEVDGHPTRDLPLDQVVGMIRGEEGTKVKLKVFRSHSTKPLIFNLTRTRIEQPNVTSKLIEGKYAYIRIHTFNQGTANKVREALEALVKKGAKGVVIDLRNNPGGLLNESVFLASLFIKKGVVVRVKGRTGKEQVYHTVSDYHETRVFDLPLVVLINKGSASASEIFSGAIRDNKRGLLIGETTFGKASVQDVINLSEGGMILTTAHYYTPRGENISKKGIKPDIEVKGQMRVGGPDPQLDKAIKVLSEEIKKKKAA